MAKAVTTTVKPTAAPSPLEVLEKEYQSKRIELLGKISTETTELLKKLVHSFGKLPDDAQKIFFKSDDGKAALKSFGLKGGDGGTPRTARTELTEEKILAFIGKEEKKKSELYEEFSGGNKVVSAKLDELVKGKKLFVTERKGKGKPSMCYRVV